MKPFFRLFMAREHSFRAPIEEFFTSEHTARRVSAEHRSTAPEDSAHSLELHRLTLPDGAPRASMLSCLNGAYELELLDRWLPIPDRAAQPEGARKWTRDLGSSSTVARPPLARDPFS